MTDKETQEVEKIKCPCCGEYTLRKPATIKSMVLDEYMASIMSGVPFSHTYRLYNDKVTVTVTTKSKQFATEIYTTTQQLAELIRATEGVDIQAATLFKDLYTTIHLYADIPSILTTEADSVEKSYTPTLSIKTVMNGINANIKAFHNFLDPDYEGEDKGAIIDICKELYAANCNERQLSALPEAVIKTIVETHNDIYTILLDTGFDSNFWTGIELA